MLIAWPPFLQTYSGSTSRPGDLILTKLPSTHPMTLGNLMLLLQLNPFLMANCSSAFGKLMYLFWTLSKALVTFEMQRDTVDWWTCIKSPLTYWKLPLFKKRSVIKICVIDLIEYAWFILTSISCPISFASWTICSLLIPKLCNISFYEKTVKGFVRSWKCLWLRKTLLFSINIAMINCDILKKLIPRNPADLLLVELVIDLSHFFITSSNFWLALHWTSHKLHITNNYYQIYYQH